MSVIRKIKESIITKWIVLYYTFFFIMGSYFLLQILFTALQFFLFNSRGQSITIQGLYVKIDGIKHQIWDLPQFHIAIILSATIIVALVYLITRLTIKGDVAEYLGFVRICRSQWVWFVYSSIVLSVGILLNEYVVGKTEVAINADGVLEKSLIILGLGVFGPFLEECLYRGYLLAKMDDILKNKRQWITILVTAFIFSALHFQYNTFELLYIFCIGIFLALMRFKTGSLWFPVIFHVAGNLYAVLNIIL